MADVRVTLRQLAEQAKIVHAKERGVTLESLRLVGVLDRLNAPVNLGMSDERFAATIGLSKDQWWKRAQAARVLYRHPEAAAMLAAGETRVSHLAMASAKITPQNAAVVLAGLRGATRRTVEALLSRISADGEMRDVEGTVELKIRLTESEYARFQRAREVLASGGKVSRDSEVLVAAVDALLARRDPVQRAERAVKRKAPAARQSASTPTQSTSAPTLPAARQSASTPTQSTSAPTLPAARQSAPASTQRPAIPAAVRHAVWQRDAGRCTHTLDDGERCPERMMLELDHMVPWCRGGAHTTENLTLRCRRHNAAQAVAILGEAVASRRGERTLHV